MQFRHTGKVSLDPRQRDAGAVLRAYDFTKRRSRRAHALVSQRSANRDREGFGREIAAANWRRRYAEVVQAAAPELLIEAEWHYYRWDTTAHGCTGRSCAAVMDNCLAAWVEPRVRHVGFDMRP